MTLIPLSQGKFAKVDDDKLELLSEYKWYFDEGYACAHSGDTVIRMHQLILPVDEGFEVDHKDHDGVNNQLSNLRAATKSQNAYNSVGRSNFYTNYRGVTFNARRGKWQAQIKVNGHYKYLGVFDSDIEAAKRYDRAASLYHGEFATLNFPSSRIVVVMET